MTKKPTKRSPIQGHGQPLIGHITCTWHNKNAYRNRKDAKTVAKMMHRQNPASTVEPYRCDALDGMWHIGASHRLKDARKDNT